MRARVVAAVTAPLVVLTGYVALDIADVVPGVLTAQGEWVAPAPLLTAEPATVATPDALAGLGEDAPVPAASVVQGYAQALRDDDRTGTSTNVSVVDLLTGEVLADVDAANPQVPASTTKLLTTVAAIAQLGSDATFTTSVTWTGETLTLVGGGDALLTDGYGHGGELDATEDRIREFGGVHPARGWAGLADLADAVAAALPAGTPISTLALDDTLISGPLYPAEFPSYALQLGYAGRIAAIAIDEGRETDDVYARRSTDPALDAAETFAMLLEERGISVGNVTRAAASGARIASVESAPLSVIAQYVSRDSDNTIAETLARLIAVSRGGAGTAEAGAAAITNTLTEIGVDTEGLQLYDGAGFSTKNRISPSTLVSTLRTAALDPSLSTILDELAIVGVSGTTTSRAASPDVIGRSLAKTGSLTGVTSMAGLVETADGRWLVYATLLDGMPYGQAEPRAAIDEFVAALAGCGCEG